MCVQLDFGSAIHAPPSIHFLSLHDLISLFFDEYILDDPIAGGNSREALETRVREYWIVFIHHLAVIVPEKTFRQQGFVTIVSVISGWAVHGCPVGQAVPREAPSYPIEPLVSVGTPLGNLEG